MIYETKEYNTNSNVIFVSDGRVKISLADLDLFRQQVLKQYQNNQLIIQDTDESNNNHQTLDKQLDTPSHSSNIFSSLANSRYPSTKPGIPVVASSVSGYPSSHSVSDHILLENNFGYKPNIPGLSANQDEYPYGPPGSYRTQLKDGFNHPETVNLETNNNDESVGYRKEENRNKMTVFDDIPNNDFEEYDLDDERETLTDDTLEYDHDDNSNVVLNDSPEATDLFINLFQNRLNSVPEVKDNGDIDASEQTINVFEQDSAESKSHDEKSNLPLGSFSDWLSKSQSSQPESARLQTRLPDFLNSQIGSLTLPSDSMNMMPSFMTSQKNNHNVQSDSSQMQAISQSKLPIFFESQSNLSLKPKIPSNIHSANERETNNINMIPSMRTRLDFKENFRVAHPLTGFHNQQITTPIRRTNKQKKSYHNLSKIYYPNTQNIPNRNNQYLKKQLKDNYMYNNLIRFNGLKRWFSHSSSRKGT